MTKNGESPKKDRGTKIMQIGGIICAVYVIFIVAGMVAGSGSSDNSDDWGFGSFVPLLAGIVTVIVGHAIRIMDAIEKR